MSGDQNYRVLVDEFIPQPGQSSEPEIRWALKEDNMLVRHKGEIGEHLYLLASVGTDGNVEQLRHGIGPKAKEKLLAEAQTLFAVLPECWWMVLSADPHLEWWQDPAHLEPLDRLMSISLTPADRYLAELRRRMDPVWDSRVDGLVGQKTETGAIECGDGTHDAPFTLSDEAKKAIAQGHSEVIQRRNADRLV